MVETDSGSVSPGRGHELPGLQSDYLNVSRVDQVFLERSRGEVVPQRPAVATQ